MAPHEIKVAYQGVPGAYSEKATRQLLGSSAHVAAIGFPSFEEAFQAVAREDVRFAVMPIENSLGGSIHANYDLLLKYGLHIVGEYDLRVEHSLLALPGVRKEDIKTVISHPQALAQCAHTIAQMGATARAEYDTAGSAKMLADAQWRDTAAVASDLAAEYYGLEVLERNVEDDASNFTRFLLLSKTEDAMLEDAKAGGAEFKTSLVFSFVESNERGQLYKALSAFSLRDIDMAKIESRPWGHSAAQLLAASEAPDAAPDAAAPADRRKYKYLFYVDLIGHQTDESIVNALRHLRELCKFVRVLGSFPTKGRLLGETRKALEAAGAFARDDATTALAVPASPRRRLTVGLYGFGNFGQFLGKTFAKHHAVRATSRGDYAAEAARLGVSFYSSETQLEQFFAGLDVLVLCVSILSFEAVVARLPRRLLEGLVVVDVLSVKTHPKRVLLRELPPSASILCTHPMFGPESGKYSWRGLPMMFERVRVAPGEHAQRVAAWLGVFEHELCRLLELSCEAHDEFAASSQFLTHLTGRVLAAQGVRPTPIDTRGFASLVRLVDDTCRDSLELFQGLYAFNPNSDAQIAKFQSAFQEVAAQLRRATGTSGTTNAPPADSMAAKYPLNPLLGKVTAAKTVVIHGLTKQLEAEGERVWSLCVGEPDFAPAARVLAAGAEALTQGRVKYTDVKGTLALRSLIAQYLARCKGVTYDPQTEVLVSNGAKQAVFQALLAVCQPGEKVVIPAPYWVSYPAIVKLVQAEPVVLKTRIEDDYLIDPAALEALLAAHAGVKAIILCNPSNPAGSLHSPEHLERLAAVLRQPRFAHILVLSDEIYEQLVYQDAGAPRREHRCFASLPGMYERTLVINGFSKSHAMPGLRVGYLAAPQYFVSQCTKLQGQFTSCASSVGQAAAQEAMALEMECVDAGRERIAEVLAVMDAKRQFVLARLRAIPKLRFAHPSSAFYVFLDLGAYFAPGATVFAPGRARVLANVDEYVEFLLREYHVALVPGSAFGEDCGLRISYASSMETLENAMDGLEKSLASLEIETSA